MTREEAIAELREDKALYESDICHADDGSPDGRLIKALDMAIEVLSAEAKPTKAVSPILADVYKWERDIALSQLEEYGIGFAERRRDDLVEVVRCKDCKHLKTMCEDEGTCYYWCKHWNNATDDWGHCYCGERREL